MDSLIADILSVDVVLVGVSLLRQQEEFETFTSEVGSEDISVEPIGIIPPNMAGVSITLNRDRISLSVLPDRTSIVKEYPSLSNLDEDLDRLAEVTVCAIRNTDTSAQQLRAYGYNMQLVFDLGVEEPASLYIGKRLFGNWFNGELVGGTGQLIFSDGESRWSFNIQPRPNNDMTTKKLYLALNLHIAEESMPHKDKIRSSLGEMREKAVDFMTQLHEGR